MIIRPVYNILLLRMYPIILRRTSLPTGVRSHRDRHGHPVHPAEGGPENSGLTADSFYPIGVSARVESVAEGDNIQVRTLERVDISDIEISDGVLTASAPPLPRPEEADLTAEEEKAAFGRLRGVLLKFVQGYQWGIWARSFIMQRKNVFDLACALTEYLNLTADEKYAILAADSRKERVELISRAINEFVEVARVSEEARSAQKDDQEQLYREAAIRIADRLSPEGAGRHAPGKRVGHPEI